MKKDQGNKRQEVPRNTKILIALFLVMNIKIYRYDYHVPGIMLNTILEFQLALATD